MGRGAVIGNPGHPTVPRPAPDVEEGEGRWDPRSDGWRPAMPSACVRVLTSPRPPDCPVDCPGRQADGSCLTDIVRAANARGVAWTFDLDRDGRWEYTGPDLGGAT